MQQNNKSLFHIPLLLIWLFIIAIFTIGTTAVNGQVNNGLAAGNMSRDTIIDLRFPFKDPWLLPYSQKGFESPLYLKLPPNIQTRVEYDPETNEYKVQRKVGNLNYRDPFSLDFDAYRQYDFQNSLDRYWSTRVKGESFESQSSLIPKLYVGGEAFDRIFGSNTINITPQGSAELIFGLQINNTENPALPEKVRKNTTFDFDNKIQMNVSGQIGDKLELGITYNTEATFNFENKTKIAYTGKDDEIIRKIEAGNVNLPLSGSLITGSQSLFGIKTELQFGRMTVTTILSQQEGQTQTIEVEGGGVTNEIEIRADDYEANKHFFLSQYYRDIYDQSLKNLPVINSGINITKIEVWITNKNNNFDDSRNVVAFLDLGEGILSRDTNIFNNQFIKYNPPDRYPSNDINDLYKNILDNYSAIRDISQVTGTLAPLAAYNFSAGQDYEKIENARKLQSTEYELNTKLGYISLNQSLNADEILAVAFEYTVGGNVFRVGEFSNEVNKDESSDAPSLILKLLKGTNLAPGLPTWDLMMKNIYSIQSSRISQEEFMLDILYQNDKTGTANNYIPAGAIDGQILLQVLNLDNLNAQLDPQRDGRFDFIDKVTINASKGRIIFPVLEPFGSYLRQKIENGNPDFREAADTYVFQELYDETQSRAQQIASKNKFLMSIRYRSSSSSEIRLNAMNVPQGSVVVTAGGMKLTENTDFTVDYTSGIVKIINEGLLESGTPIKISLENQAQYGIQSKTMIGSHFDYRINRDFNIGGTFLHLKERPLTTKVNIGQEPISNTIWGFNTNYKGRAPWLTRAIDFLPFLETKEESSITFTGEFAQLVPGHSKVIQKEGESLIDDFEGSETSIDVKPRQQWVLASTPMGQPTMFPEADYSNDLAYGFNRARLAWYQIDPLFLRNNSTTPSHIANNPEEQSSHYVREIREQEIFPYKESPNNFPSYIPVLNMAYYPKERGPYNFDAMPNGSISAGISEEGLLRMPETRWAGVMRKLSTNDFESANVEYIEFWMMDPFVEDTINNISRDDSDPGLYFNLGNVSEDILKDGRKSFENGLPTVQEVTYVDTTTWGRVPVTQSFVNAFDNEVSSRIYQDVGLDGLNDDDERSFFQTFLDSLQMIINPASQSYLDALNDPASDNFHYYRGTDFDERQVGILDRYKKFNGLEGNSPTPEQTDENYPTQSTTLPDVEDINMDNTLSETESYFQYKVSLKKENFQVGKNFITDAIVGKNEEGDPVTWYQFKVPIYEPEKVIGSIQDFKSIRFMRLFLKGISDRMILRFATLELVRGDWRKYNLSMLQGTENLTTPEYTRGKFEVTSVNIEENGNRYPVNYVLPPDVTRITDPTNPHMIQKNEQSIALKVVDLEDGDARAAYKNVGFDFRQYRKLQMYVHAEAIDETQLQDGDLRAFIRIGSDYTQNYYEYEIPLALTPHLSPPVKYDQRSDADAKIVWPVENNINIVLEVFQAVKQARNDAMRVIGSIIDQNSVFEGFDGNNRVLVKGNPNLSNIRTIMVGVRNPASNGGNDLDDGKPKTAIVWMNELRLTDFNEDGGWAANARMTARLADLGTVSVSGGTSNPGFGSIEKKVQERSKEEIFQYDMSTSLQLGRFFPKKAGVNIPMYVGYSERRSNPQYNPLDPDIPLSAALNNSETKAERDSIIYISQAYNRRKSINFTNMKVEGQNSRDAKIYSLSNWSVSYSYNEVLARNINTEKNLNRSYTGVLSYIYNSKPRPWEPFREVAFLSKPAFRLIKDFNLYYEPSMLRFQTNLDRRYNEVRMRNVANPYLKIEPTYNKNFNWNRLYDFKWDLTRSIKLDFTASNIARIDEPDGPLDKTEPDYQAKRDSIWQNIVGLGRNTQYHHGIIAQYTVPINKISLLNWVTLTTNYRTEYDWTAGPITADTIRLGNTIENSNQFTVNGQLNLQSLYGKVGFLKKIEDKYKRKSTSTKQQANVEVVNFTQDKFSSKKGKKTLIIHDLMTKEVRVQVFDSNNAAVEVEMEVVNDRRIRVITPVDVDNGRVEIEGNLVVRENPFIYIAENTARILMGVRNVSLNYNSGNGTFLPGFMPEPQYLGMQSSNGILAPGFGFVMGMQDPVFGDRAAESGWITTDSTMNDAFFQNQNESFLFRASIQPLPDLRIDINANRSMSTNLEQYYIFQGGDTFNAANRMVSGNFSMSFLSLSSAFEKGPTDSDYTSDSWERFKNNRFVISRRLAEQRVNEQNPGSPDYDPNYGSQSGYADGYGPTSQEVLIPAFLAAYSNTDPDKIGLSSFPSLLSIMPNWRINYNGLQKIEFFQKFVKQLNIIHSYKSTYSVGSYSTNLFYDPDEQDGLNYIRDLQLNFLPDREIGGVSISEQFNPLISLDLQMNNSFTARLEMKKIRNLSLSFNNNQMMENRSDEYVIGAGYRFQQVPITIKTQGTKKKFQSDLDVRANISLRDTRMIMRKLEEDVDKLTSGVKAFVIGFTADYTLSSKFRLRLFFDQNLNKPHVSSSFATTNTKLGFKLQFTLTE